MAAEGSVLEADYLHSHSCDFLKQSNVHIHIRVIFSNLILGIQIIHGFGPFWKPKIVPIRTWSFLGNRIFVFVYSVIFRKPNDTCIWSLLVSQMMFVFGHF